MESSELAALILTEALTFAFMNKKGTRYHGFCAELRLEGLLCDFKFIFVVDLTTTQRSGRAMNYAIGTYRCEVHQVDHAISECLYLNIYLFIPFFLDSVQIFSRGLVDSRKGLTQWKEICSWKL
jgi:hypothetical protein